MRFTIKILHWFLLKFRIFCWIIYGIFCKSITISTKQGIFTVMTEDGAIGKSLYTTKEFELDFMLKAMELLRKLELCPPQGQGTFLDVGANNGVISIGMLHTGELEKAIAIEPEPRNFALLQHNVKQNGLDNKIVCMPCAVSNKKGELLFELSPTNFGDHRVRVDMKGGERFNESKRQTIEVPCKTIDEIIDTPISVIWIDVQGYEGYAFLGAKNLLSKGIPVVSEIWLYGIKRAGMSQEQFCEIARTFWSSYWVLRGGKFVKYPIDTLNCLFDELGNGRGSCNVIFTR